MDDDADIVELKEKFLKRGDITSEGTFKLEADKLAGFAKATGQTASRFTDPADPDFQAAPTFPCSLATGRMLPQDFPDFGGMGMDAGKAVELLQPIRPGVTITGKSHLHDIYTKTGRSGRMIFYVSRLELFDEDGNHLANSDSRNVIREKPTG
jgi:hypothetical protein